MHKDLIKKLQILKSIEPDKDFAEGTRRLVLVSGKQSTGTSYGRILKWAFVPAFAIFLVVTISILVLNPRGKTTSVSFDSIELQEELSELDFNIHIKELAYQQDINQTIALALDEISNSQASHLNRSILESEQDIMNQEEIFEDPEVDILLNRVIN